MASESNAQDKSIYGTNKKGKVSLCESCVYVGYCMKTLRFYKCNDYIKGYVKPKYGYLHEKTK